MGEFLFIYFIFLFPGSAMGIIKKPHMMHNPRPEALLIKISDVVHLGDLPSRRRSRRGQRGYINQYLQSQEHIALQAHLEERQHVCEEVCSPQMGHTH